MRERVRLYKDLIVKSVLSVLWALKHYGLENWIIPSTPAVRWALKPTAKGETLVDHKLAVTCSPSLWKKSDGDFLIFFYNGLFIDPSMGRFFL